MRIGLAGIAHWHSGMHATAVRRAGASIVGAWDGDPALTAAFAAREACPAFADLAGLLAVRPDAVVVMGDPLTMPARLIATAEAGLPAIVEKPVAPSGAALAPLVAGLAGRDAWIAVALPQRVGPLHAELARLRRDDRAGPLSHAQFRIINGPPSRYRADHVDWVLDPAVGGGGALRNLGIHGVDAFLAIVGEQAVTIEHVAFGRPVHAEPVEDYALLTLRAADGTLGHIEAGYTFASTAPGGDFEWRISARNAYLLDRGGEPVVTTLDDGVTRRLAATAGSGRYDEFMAETLRRLAAREPPLATLADLARAMVLIDQAYGWRGG